MKKEKLIVMVNSGQKKIQNFERIIKGFIKLSITKFKKALNLDVTDFQRWSNTENLSANWESRAKAAASLISPNSKVLEFGAGAMKLPKYLPENCIYVPSDIVKRTPNINLP